MWAPSREGKQTMDSHKMREKSSSKTRAAKTKTPLEKKTPSKKSTLKVKKSLSAQTLEELGAARLAAILMEMTKGNAVLKRRLRLEILSTNNPSAAIAEIEKRLTTIAKSRSFVSWSSVQAYARDLDAQRKAIVDLVAISDAPRALDLMERFLNLAPLVLERCEADEGAVLDVFFEAGANFGEIAQAARIDARALAEKAAPILLGNCYGEYNDLLERLTTALGPSGLKHLKTLMEAALKTPPQKPKEKQRLMIGGDRNGFILSERFQEDCRIAAKRALCGIADALGDANAFIQQFTAKEKTEPLIAIAIARRLLQAGRFNEALQTIEAGAPKQRREEFLLFEPENNPSLLWEETKIDILEALDRKEEAQSARWACFETYLSKKHLQDYLKRLGDFDDLDEEKRALDYVKNVKNFHHALFFLVSWGAVDQAGRLVLDRAKEIDGNLYEILADSAERLAARQPLAATLLWRAMIDFSLNKARSNRYKHAMRHFMDCESVAALISDYGAIEPHETYARHLHSKHKAKSSFWKLAPQQSLDAKSRIS